MEDSRVKLHLGDCLEVLKGLPSASVDAVVTDPPYGLGFMGRAWDRSVPSSTVWAECLRVLKPGGHLLAFAGTRTQHRMACAIEDAGFEIRDMLAWVYGSGFPKSHNLNGEWQGWGTTLKPALEPITLARKPLGGTVAQCVLEHGTGAMNIDGCRVGLREARQLNRAGSIGYGGSKPQGIVEDGGLGRWPANLIHDGGPEALEILGKAARFFYCPKASKADREDGCAALPLERTSKLGGGDNDKPNLDPVSERFRTAPSGNNHPTVKPTDLMRYLCRLITPPGGIVLDPFMGSGSTGRGAVLESFRFVGIEIDPNYLEIARARIAAVQDCIQEAQQPKLFDE